MTHLAVDNVYSALVKALMTEPSIASQLGVFNGGSVPLVKAGVLAESEEDLPAITMRMEILDELNKEYGDESFILLVSAETEIEATKVARSIIKIWGDGAVNVDGFAMSITSSGLGSAVSPTANSIGVPVSMRVIYRRD